MTVREAMALDLRASSSWERITAWRALAQRKLEVRQLPPSPTNERILRGLNERMDHILLVSDLYLRRTDLYPTRWTLYESAQD